MTLWRDPLDELIEDLEQALPVSPTPNQQEDLPRLVDIQRPVRAVLAHADGRGPDPSNEPWFQKVREQLASRVDRGITTAKIDP